MTSRTSKMPSVDDVETSSTSSSYDDDNVVVSLLILPSVLKRMIASYLDPKSAIQYQQTSRSCYKDISLSALLPKYELLYSQIAHGETMTGDIPIPSVFIPIFGNPTHSVCLKCRWKDQGWGNRKGRIYIVAHRIKKKTKKTQADVCEASSPDDIDTDVDEENETTITTINNKNEKGTEKNNMGLFGGGTVIYKSPIAPHTMQNLEITFVPNIRYTRDDNNNDTTNQIENQDDDDNDKDEEETIIIYRLWMVVGGGGGHLLIIEDLHVQTLVFDDIHKTMKHTYRTLYRLGLLGDVSGGGNVLDGNDNNENDKDEYDEESNNNDLIFYTNLLHHILHIMKLSSPEQQSTSRLVEFFQNNNLPIHPCGLSAASLVCDFFLQYLNNNERLSNNLNIPREETMIHDTTKEMILPPFTLLRFAVWEGSSEDFVPKYCTRIPFFRGRTQSIRLSCNLQGDVGAKLYVVALQYHPDVCMSESSRYESFFGQGRLVGELSNVTEISTPYEMTFIPDDNEIYYIHKDPGGSQQHILSVNSLQVHLTVVDNDDHIEQYFQQLLSQDKLDTRQKEGSVFQLQLLLSAIDFLCHNTESRATELHHFFQRHNLSIDETSLHCLRRLISNLLDYKEQNERKKTSKTTITNNNSDEIPLRMISVM